MNTVTRPLRTSVHETHSAPTAPRARLPGSASQGMRAHRPAARAARTSTRPPSTSVRRAAAPRTRPERAQRQPQQVGSESWNTSLGAHLRSRCRRCGAARSGGGPVRAGGGVGGVDRADRGAGEQVEARSPAAAAAARARTGARARRPRRRRARRRPRARARCAELGSGLAARAVPASPRQSGRDARSSRAPRCITRSMISAQLGDVA